MKKLLKVIIVFMLIYVGVTFAAGFYVKHEHDKLLTMMEQDLAGYGLKIVEQSYKQGLLVSQSHVVVALPVNALLEKQVYLNINSDIRSGPWLGGAEFGIGKVDTVVFPSSDEVLQSALKFWQGQNIATSQTLIGFSLNRRNQTNILPLQYSDEKVSIDFRGGAGQIDHSFVSFSFPYYEHREGDGKATIEGVRFQANANAGNTTFNGALSVEQIVVMNVMNGGRTVNISDVFLDMRNEHLLGNMLNSQMKGRMLLAEGEESARFEMDYEIQNIYEPAMKQLRNMQASTVSYSEIGNEEMNGVLLRLLVERPRMKLNLSLTQGGKTAYMRSNFSVDELSSTDRLSRNAGLLVLTRGRAHAEVKVPRVMMESGLFTEDTRLIVGNWLQSKLLLEDGANYVGEYTYGNQTLMVNKQQVSLF